MKYHSFEDFRAHVGKLYTDGNALAQQAEQLDDEIQDAEQALARLRANRADVAMQLQNIVTQQNVSTCD